MKKTKSKLSVVLATRNEETNIKACLESVKNLADEVVVVDEQSTDKTTEIAKSMGARVLSEPHHENFHITKRKAMDAAVGDWILQLDADERVSPELANEIKQLLSLSNEEMLGYEVFGKNKTLFKRHQEIIEARDGKLGETMGQVVAFFIPRVNYFLGKPLIHAGVYPDGVIRLIKAGKARLPAKSVHEQMEIDGEVRWLNHHLDHHDSPTLRRYLARLNRYTDLHATELAHSTSRNTFSLLMYFFIKPFTVFLRLFFRHKGYKDGIRGFLWSAFSALHYPVAYAKYWIKSSKRIE